ncbi:MAG: 50S ribosomal protein L11 methyltransferase [Clostridia bacterium]|nr:50S ribosomal protein L11 methyltransferase [Clostridia bacterium]
MDWIKLTISTTTQGIETVCAVLMEQGVSGVEIDDSLDFHNFLDNNRDKWDYVDEELLRAHESGSYVSFYVTDDADGKETLSMVKSALSALKLQDTDGEYGTLEIAGINMKEEDWSENWKQYFKPLNVGDKILILPEWETIDEPTDRTVFTVNPGMSFGTGAHHTTQLCIKALEIHLKNGMTVLDLGCGSGILSIISLLLGATHATAVDIDENAVKIAIENAQKNNIDLNKYRTMAGNVTCDKELFSKISDRKYDIVLANIVADVIIGIRDIVPEFLRDGGIFITSGIIEERLNDVKTAYENSNFMPVSEEHQGGWVSLVYKK